MERAMGNGLDARDALAKRQETPHELVKPPAMHLAGAEGAWATVWLRSLPTLALQLSRTPRARVGNRRKTSATTHTCSASATRAWCLADSARKTSGRVDKSNP